MLFESNPTLLFPPFPVPCAPDGALSSCTLPQSHHSAPACNGLAAAPVCPPATTVLPLSGFQQPFAHPPGTSILFCWTARAAGAAMPPALMAKLRAAFSQCNNMTKIMEGGDAVARACVSSGTLQAAASAPRARRWMGRAAPAWRRPHPENAGLCRAHMCDREVPRLGQAPWNVVRRAETEPTQLGRGNHGFAGPGRPHPRSGRPQATAVHRRRWVGRPCAPVVDSASSRRRYPPLRAPNCDPDPDPHPIAGDGRRAALGGQTAPRRRRQVRGLLRCYLWGAVACVH